MNPLAIFKKPVETQAAPARAALDAQLRAYSEKNRQRLAVHEQDAAARRHGEEADAALARVVALRAALDQSIADRLYSEGAPADLGARRSQLAEAEAEADRLAPVGRAAGIAHTRFSAQAATLTNEMKALYESVPRLLHAALLEKLEQEAVRFREAEEQFRAAHRAAFVVAVAADAVAKLHKLGVFVRSGTHTDLFVSRPDVPAFQRGPADPWQAKLARDAVAKSFDVEAEQLINSMLNAEGV